MKKLLPILSIAFLMAACNSTPKAGTASTVTALEQQVPVNQDTAGLAQFQSWKIQNELKDVEEYNHPEQPVMIAPEKPKKVRTVYHTSSPKTSTPVPAKADTPSLPESSSGGSVSSPSESGTMSTESAETAKAEEKKGVSKAVKGAVIGGVAGAGAGAVINKKNRVVGAVVGAVIGAGGGYVIGRKMDKKESL